jgi:hypothetical protein
VCEPVRHQSCAGKAREIVRKTPKHRRNLRLNSIHKKHGDSGLTTVNEVRGGVLRCHISNRFSDNCPHQFSNRQVAPLPWRTSGLELKKLWSRSRRQDPQRKRNISYLSPEFTYRGQLLWDWKAAPWILLNVERLFVFILWKGYSPVPVECYP